MPIPENLWRGGGGDGGKEELFSLSPCLLVSLSPCLFVPFSPLSPCPLQKFIAFVAVGKHQDAQIS